MSLQQIIAFVVIIAFILRIWQQKKKQNINSSEFFFWLIFWLFSGAAIIALPYLDSLVSDFGFSASGIEFLLYLAVVILFYFIFRLRLRLARLDKEITKLVRAVSIKADKK